MKFYNMRKKTTVEVDDTKCLKHVYVKTNTLGKPTTKKAYGVTAVDDDGTKLNKFITKEVYDKLKCPAAK